jgi:hypothetical protein
MSQNMPNTIRMEAKRDALEAIVRRPPTEKRILKDSKNSKVAQSFSRVATKQFTRFSIESLLMIVIDIYSGHPQNPSQSLFFGIF